MQTFLTLLLIAVMAVLTSSCDTTSPTQQAFTNSAAQTASYFAGLEVLTKADTEKDWQEKKDVIIGLTVVLRGINNNVTDPVQIRELFARYFAGKPPHWMALSQLVVSWVNTRGTENGRSELINAIVSGLEAAAGMPYTRR